MPYPRLSVDQAAMRGAEKVHAGRFASRQTMPSTIGKIGSPPKHLNKAEKAIWREISTAIPAGVAGSADRIAIEMASRLLYQFRTEPDMQASRVAILMQLLSRLGLDPQARTRLQTPQAATPPKQDDAWGFLN